MNQLNDDYYRDLGMLLDHYRRTGGILDIMYDDPRLTAIQNQLSQQSPASFPRALAPRAAPYQAPVPRVPAYQAPAPRASVYQAPVHRAIAPRAPVYQAPKLSAPRAAAYQAPAPRAAAYQAPTPRMAAYQAPIPRAAYQAPGVSAYQPAANSYVKDVSDILKYYEETGGVHEVMYDDPRLTMLQNYLSSSPPRHGLRNHATYAKQVSDMLDEHQQFGGAIEVMYNDPRLTSLQTYLQGI